MNDEEIQAFLEHYNHDIPDPIHEPLRFGMFVKMWRYYNDTQQNNTTHSTME
jgi:hypothetical protein